MNPWKNKFCMFSITKSWDGKFVMKLSCNLWVSIDCILFALVVRYPKICNKPMHTSSKYHTGSKSWTWNCTTTTLKQYATMVTRCTTTLALKWVTTIFTNWTPTTTTIMLQMGFYGVFPTGWINREVCV